MNDWLAHYEPIWLFFGIYGEILITLVGTVVSTVYIAKRVSQKQSKARKKAPEFDNLTSGEGK